MGRHLRRWSAQWQASADRAVPAVDELSRRLATALPDRVPTGLVHGDFRLDNCIVAADDPTTLNAVLDWEMSTLGDPLADLGMLLFYWREPGDRRPALTPAVTMTQGFATRRDLVERYVARTGHDTSALTFYEAFAHLKFAIIAQGIAARVRSGTMAGQDFGDLAAEVETVAADGLLILQRREG